MRFEDLIHPIHEKEFFKEFFEKKPLYNDHVIEDAESILSLKMIDDVIKSSLFSPNELRIAKDGTVYQPSLYIDKNLKRQDQAEFVNFSKALALYADGATLIFESLHQRIDGLGDFCQYLEMLFQTNVQSNVYLTPGGSKGFARHFDTHEVFVVQIHGTKDWIIYDNPPIRLPVNTQSHHAFKDIQYPIKHEFTLRPGQCVYIPRGYMHEAKSNEAPSLHVTFGVFTYKWINFLTDLVAEMQYHNDGLREALPLSMLRDPDQADVATAFSKIFGDLKYADLCAKIVSKRKEAFSASRTPRIGKGLSSLSSIKTISADTTLRRLDGLAYSLKESDDKAVLQVYNKTISFPGALMPHLNFILQNDTFRLSDLDNSLSDKGKSVLVERLVKESILEIANL